MVPNEVGDLFAPARMVPNEVDRWPCCSVSSHRHGRWSSLEVDADVDMSLLDITSRLVARYVVVKCI
jgi:hypothetical protein